MGRSTPFSIKKGEGVGCHIRGMCGEIDKKQGGLLMKKSYFEPEIEIASISTDDDILTMSNESYDNGTNDGTWEDFEG